MAPNILRVAAVALALLASAPVLAQEATEVVTTEDDGMDWGWLGLLGLAGLAGLQGRRRDNTSARL